MSKQGVENSLQYRFKNGPLLEEALTHPSFAHVMGKTHRHYERLEFLGDAILGAVLADKLFQLFPEVDEGFLAQAKSALGKGTLLAQIATGLGLPAHIKLSPGEIAQGGKMKPNLLASAWEAIIGAIFLDGGNEAAKKTILASYEALFPEGLSRSAVETLLKSDNPKGRLQERFQGHSPHATLEYTLTDTHGPDHNKRYHVCVKRCDTGEILGEGKGSSKKMAEEEAAGAALHKLPKH